MITGKINLGKLVHLNMKLKNQQGIEKDCLIIPIEANNLFAGKDGNVYLDLVAFEIKTPKDDTHIVKQSLPKDVREKMSEQQLKDMPILGNLRTSAAAADGGAANNPAPGTVFTGDDMSKNMPF